MKRGYVPNQHGAWAMLILPFLLGMFAAGPAWPHAPLFAGWLLVYLFSFPLLQWIKTGNKKVYAKPAIVYGTLLVPAGIAVAALKPDLFRYAPLLVPLFLINVYYARRNRERDLANDLAAVLLFCLMVFVAYDAGGGVDRRLAAELFALSFFYFTGTVFYVKTMIREKNNPLYYRLSVGYHLALLAAGAFWLPAGMAVPLAVLLARAVISPRAGISVKTGGILEIAWSVMMLCAVLICYRLL